jgi:flagellar M-ring protein FliF
MDTSLAPTALAASAAPARSAISVNRLSGLPLRGKMLLGVGAAALLAIALVATLYSRQPDFRVLYANLSDRDGGAVVAQLATMNIPHKYSEGGGAIMVPADKVHDVRLKLASQGLPKGGAVGFELMENQKFGTTQFQERLNFQRGLEGELARSIMALSAVQSARVHLALPTQTAFMREQQKPSASVLLSLHGGRALERGQIAGIVHLVASSVPELTPKSVSVVDQNGALLSETGDTPNGLDASQLQYVRQIEQNLATRVMSILEPLVGVGNVKAQIVADVDFTQSESTAELYTPNQGAAPAAVRTQQLSEVPGAGAGGGGAGSSGGTGAGGIPGALSNQPAAPQSSPINGGAQPLSAGGAGGGTGAAAGVRRDATTSYEVDKTVRVTRSATGNVRKLNAAVIVNHASSTGTDGKPQLKAIAPAQMEQINALVREAIGYNKDRGDSVNVVNAPFTSAVVPATVELPIWQRPETLDVARGLGPWLALPLVCLIIVFGLVRPAMKMTRTQMPGLTVATSIQDAIPLPMPGETGSAGVPLLPTAEAAQMQARTAQLDGIRQIAKQNPATVANVVRSWVNQPA